MESLNLPSFRSKSSFLAFLDKNTDKYIQLLSANNSAHQEFQSKYFPSKTHNLVAKSSKETGGKKLELKETGWWKENEEEKKKEEEDERKKEEKRRKDEEKRTEEDYRTRKEEEKMREEEGRRKKEEEKGREEKGGRKVIVKTLPKLNLSKRNASEPNFMNILRTESDWREEERERNKITFVRIEKEQEKKKKNEVKRSDNEEARMEEKQRRTKEEEENKKKIEKEERGKKNLKEEERLRMEVYGTMDNELKEGIREGITNKSFWNFKGFGRKFSYEEAGIMKSINCMIKKEERIDNSFLEKLNSRLANLIFKRDQLTQNNETHKRLEPEKKTFEKFESLSQLSKEMLIRKLDRKEKNLEKGMISHLLRRHENKGFIFLKFMKSRFPSYFSDKTIKLMNHILLMYSINPLNPYSIIKWDQYNFIFNKLINKNISRKEAIDFIMNFFGNASRKHDFLPINIFLHNLRKIISNDEFQESLQEKIEEVVIDIFHHLGIIKEGEREWRREEMDEDVEKVEGKRVDQEGVERKKEKKEGKGEMEGDVRKDKREEKKDRRKEVDMRRMEKSLKEGGLDYTILLKILINF